MSEKYLKIKQEIIKAASDKSKDKDTIFKVQKELEILEDTTGLEGKNNLDNFYSIWQKNLNRPHPIVGHKNEINSWAAWALNLTDKKPEGDFLPTRRAFARAGFPDIDVDFDDMNRHKIYDYVINKYGRDYTANVGTWGGLKPRSAITRVGKAMDIAGAFHKGQDEYIKQNAAKVKEINDHLPKERNGKMVVRDSSGKEVIVKTVKEAYDLCPDFKFYMDQYPEMMEHLYNIEGLLSIPGCLAKNTPILTENGWIEIDKLNGNDAIAYLSKDKNINYTKNYQTIKTGYKSLYRMIISSNQFIDVTDEHLIFTDQGCVSFKEIRNNNSQYQIYAFQEKDNIVSIDLYSISSIEEMPYDDVYDISIHEDKDEFFFQENNFIANGVIVHNSHAGGLVISDIPISSIAPLRKGRGEVEFATHYDKGDLESIGLIKFDFLAIKTLSVIALCIKMIKDNYGIDIDIENLPLNDKKTLDLYRSGKLDGVFQCESPGMQNVMKEISVDMFDDIVAAIALYRPGPISSIPEYCKRKAGLKDVDYFHPSIKRYVESILSRTYGVLVYQEQLMQVCNQLAGFTITDGYVMIKAVGKKMTDLLLKFESQFVSGCVANGVPASVAKDYWSSFIVPFADYGFNLAHCLDGNMRIKDKNTNKFYTIEEAWNLYYNRNDNDSFENLVLDSYIGGEIVEDILEEVFITGEKEVYEVELDNGMIISCTLEHKFLCSDGKIHTLKDIMEKDLEILYEEEEF